MGIPVATVTCAGQPLDPTVEVMEIEIVRELNRIPEAKLVLLDGGVGRGSFTLSDGEAFVPGKPVRIALRYEGEDPDTPLFEGLVVRHAVEAGTEGTRLRVELKDAAVKLTRQRSSTVFRELSDDGAIRTLLSQAQVVAGTLEATQPSHPELVQYYASDWDFIVSRADVQGLVVDVHLGKLSLAPMAPTGSPRRRLDRTLGQILDLDIEIDASHQWGQVSGVAWDLAGQKVRGPEQAAQPEVQVGNLDATTLADALGSGAYTLLHPVPLEQAELKGWADARLLRSRLSLLRGRVLVAGDPALVPRDIVELFGIGDRFDGPALVSAVTHRVDHEGWKTELRLGLSPDWFARRPDIPEVPAGGLLPPVTGLQIAQVAGFAADPLGEHRIKITLPALDASAGPLWARVLRPDAGKDRGLVFWPESGDEVVVGFLNGDPRQAVVLGSLHGSANTPPAVVGGPSEANPRRALVSRKGAVIAFDDDKVQICIQTPGGQKILLDDDAKQITATDSHGNQITLSEKGITLKSAADLEVEASGQVVIKGSAVDIQ
jgi:Rhs element Vgr protein